MSSQRVAIICWGPVAPRENGYFQRVWSIAVGLVRLGNSVTVYEFVERPTPCDRQEDVLFVQLPLPPSAARESRVTGFLSFSPVTVVLSQLSVLMSLWKIRGKLRDYELIYVGGSLFMLACVLLRLLRAHVVLDTINVNSRLAYSMVVTKSSALIRASLWTIMEGFACRFCDSIIFVSNEDRKWALTTFRIDRVTHVLPHIVVFPRPKAIGEESIFGLDGLPMSVPLVTFVGDMASIQNRAASDYLIKVLGPRLLSERPQVRVVLVGRPPEGPLKDLPKNLIVSGYLRDLDRVLTRSTLFVAPMPYPSGRSSKMQLYLRSGKPVVATPEALGGFDPSRISSVTVSSLPSFAGAVIDVLDRIHIESDPQDYISQNTDASRVEFKAWEHTLSQVVASTGS